MNTTSPVFVFDAAPAMSQDLSRRLQVRGFSPTRLDPAEVLGSGDSPGGLDLAVLLVDPQAPTEQNERVAAVLRRLVARNVATVVWGANADLRREGGPLVEWVPVETGPDEVVGKLGTLARYVPLVKGLERELQHLHRLGEQLNRYVSEIDQEMRLAGRLQRDFLPRQLPRIPPYEFEVLYSPASWVSGDIYDVFRVDEHHVGMFLADAMGHGVAAGLVTMFVRQALMPKRVSGHSYAVVEPADALQCLHQCLCRQHLPDCQFLTAVYGIIDTHSGRVRLARAGHPYPLHIRRDGTICEVQSTGTLLGLTEIPAEFTEVGITLEPGDKLLLFTDGAEDALLAPGPAKGDGVTFTPHLRRWARLPAPQFIGEVQEYLDSREGSLHPADDATLLLLGVSETADPDLTLDAAGPRHIDA
jgi:sigma-B regulation protein RsbU (phosphoserine phosphatase)